MLSPIDHYFEFPFADRATHAQTAAQLLDYLTASYRTSATGPDRAVVWTTRPGARESALYLSRGAVNAANFAKLVIGQPNRIRAEKLPEDLDFLFGADADRRDRS